jgi:glycosyltransferase involved in cell wall biosynthesis
MYLILQRLIPLNVRPVIKIDCLWYYSSPVKHYLKKILFRWLDKIVSCYVVWAAREIECYSEAFGLPPEKFTFIPYHTTADLKNIKIKKGDYIFSGGNFARDYLTLAKAVDGLDVDVRIACTNSEALNGILFPSNVNIVGVNHSEFMDLMARSGVNVVPLTKGLLHSGGQQTFLNAMAMGKAVIVADPEGAKDYIDDRIDGILVEPLDPDKLRNAIIQLINDPSFSEEIGMAASRKAGLLDTETHLAAIVRLSRKYM